ncbi:MAG: hypothetical protein ACI9OO_002061 [Bacteroidia bacterium]|jgi:uncharacterized protein YqeY
MAEQPLISTVTEAMKAAMKARNKERLSAIRLILADFKRIEIDERIDIDDARCLAVLDKMCKQRRDSIKQYEDADRPELAAVEYAEIAVIQSFLPQQLTEQELDTLVAQAISETGAESIKGMGQVMAILKPQIQGRADVGQVSQRVKSTLQ